MSTDLRAFLVTMLARIGKFVVLAAVGAALLISVSQAKPVTTVTSAPTVLTVGRALAAQPIAPGFVGLSLEYWAVPDYAGSDPSQLNPVFVQLIRNLAAGSAPVLRIGGVTTDNSWWPAPGLSKPAGVTFALTPAWTAVMRALARALGARLILGINLEADSTAVAATEARRLLAGIGRRQIEALELGNEPELYGSFVWGISGAPGRPPGYDFADFEQDFTRIAAALPKVPLAGPTDGSPSWFKLLGRFLSDEPRVAVATLHRYPLQQCFVAPDKPNYPTIANLLAPTSSRALADSVIAAVKVAHAHHIPVRIDEMNTISCGNVPAVGDSFASALWALDALFEMARVGVDGVNIHTFPGVGTALFGFQRVERQWRGTVAPEYYGLDMFAQAAPPGSRLLSTSFTRRGSSGLKAWATRAPDGTIRVVVINDGSRTRTLAIAALAASPGAGGTVERLRAPSLSASGGVTLGGQRFMPGTTTGLLAGPRRAQTVTPSAGKYTLSVPAGSAAMLTLSSP
jgi:Glycosyl hydrolase family 79 C-terminal beta domain